MKKYIITLLMLFSITPLFGGAQRVNLIVSDTGLLDVPTSYTVPSGKVLIIDAVRVQATGGTPTNSRIRLSVRYDNATLNSGEDIIVNESYVVTWNFLQEKIHLKAGDSFSAPLDLDYIWVRIMGTLIDEADLFAVNLPVELDNTRVTGNKLMADAKVSSPRPHRIKVQSSENLNGFSEDTTAEVQKTGTTGTSVVSVDRSGTGKKFVRVTAKTIPRK